MSFATTLSSFFRQHRRALSGVGGGALILLACSGFVAYQDRVATAALRESVIQEAKAGGYAAAEKAMRAQPELWLKKEYAVSEYLQLLKNDGLTAVGLPEGGNFKTAVLLVTRSGELGYVSDTWRGSVTERSMLDRPAGLRVITVGGERAAGQEMTPLGFVQLVAQLLFLGLIAFALKGMLPIGSGRYKPARGVPTRFEDVIGAAEAKAALQDIVDFLKAPEAYHRLGARPSRGVLLSGPPGTGKTLLAKALAGECGVSFIACSGADFSSKFYGVGIASVKALFKQARNEDACIVFIDEIDGIGKRTGDGNPGAQEGNRIINQLLIEIDGFAEDSKVIVIGATNLPENVDPALLREGRFDRKVTLRLPEVAEREALLRYYSRRVTMAEGIDFPQMARLTLGLSPAAIAAAVNQAAVRAARAGDAQVFMQHMADAIETSHLGELNGTLLTPAELYRTAIHEAGHALAAVLRQSGKVEKVTVLPRGSALGVTFISQEEAVRMHTEKSLKHRLDVMLAGRCAEEILFGDVSNGAASDLHHATDIATGMIARFGFGEGLAVLSQEQLRSPALLEQVNGLLGARYAETRTLLTEHRNSLEAIADRLLKEETIEGTVVRELAGVPA